MTWAIFEDGDHEAAILEITSTESDRVVAIVSGSLLERAIKQTLKERLRNDKSYIDKLLRENRPLGNSGAQVDLLYLLHAIEKPTFKAIEALLGIRNYFAHNLNVSFASNDEKLQANLKNLRLHEGLTYYPHTVLDEMSTIQIEKIETNRDKFLINLKLSLGVLMRDRVSHHTWSNVRFAEDEQAQVYKDWNKKKAARVRETLSAFTLGSTDVRLGQTDT